MNKNESQSQPKKEETMQCEQALTQKVGNVDIFVLLKFEIKFDIIIF